MATVRIAKRIEIQAPPEQVFAFISDPRSLPSILPALVEISNLPELPLVPGAVFSYKYRMAGTVINGIWTADELQPPHRYRSHTKGVGESRWLQEVSPAGAGALYSLTIDYTIPEGLLRNFVAEALIAANDRDMDDMVANLKKALEKTT